MKKFALIFVIECTKKFMNLQKGDPLNHPPEMIQNKSSLIH